MKRFLTILSVLALVAVSCEKEPQRRPTPGPTPGPTPTEKISWRELPADDDDLTSVTHYYGKSIGTERNYTLGYSYQYALAMWVAYPLYKGQWDGTDRSDAWNWDSKIPHQYQMDLSKGYYSKGLDGYDRGHQLPSKDRTFNSTANVQTFYYTNMTPQLSDFNQKIWADLEGAVRSYASNCDTLYVVTGCSIEGYKKTVSYGGTTQPVPTGYYKALLAYTKRGGRYGEWNAMGFFLDHKTSAQLDPSGKRQWINFAMSIDELEAKLGFNFFANFEKEVGAVVATAVEAQTPKTGTFWF